MLEALARLEERRNRACKCIVGPQPTGPRDESSSNTITKYLERIACIFSLIDTRIFIEEQKKTILGKKIITKYKYS